MSRYDCAIASHGYATPQGYASNASNTAYAILPATTSGTLTRPPSVPRTPSPLTLNPVPVPSGCHPIELVQFWRGRGSPLHWALFVRITSTPRTATSPRGNFYELAGTEETYTAQFLQSVVFEPGKLPDWRGTHVIGWVSPGQTGVLEGLMRQVHVWRHRPDWRSQNWVYDVVSAVGGNYQGVCMDNRVTFGGLYKHMEKLLEAWERGDI